MHFAKRLKWTYAVNADNDFGWITGFSRGVDMPLTSEEYSHAIGYFAKNCSRTITRKNNFRVDNLIHGSGVFVVLHGDYRKVSGPWANLISFFSTTPKKNCSLAKKIGLPLKPFTENPDFVEWAKKLGL